MRIAWSTSPFCLFQMLRQNGQAQLIPEAVDPTLRVARPDDACAYQAL
jgi:hypothetical protein